MKPLLLIFFLCATSALNRLPAQCSTAPLWKHVYHPERFKRYGCRTVTGVIHLIRSHEDDGDYHVLLQLDPHQPHYLNQKNMDRQQGCLVLEIICADPPITQADAIEPCKKCPHPLKCPKKNQHVSVTGTFVTDTEGGHGWNEIHPVSKIEIIQ